MSSEPKPPPKWWNKKMNHDKFTKTTNWKAIKNMNDPLLNEEESQSIS
jgi:hypothetical protein